MTWLAGYERIVGNSSGDYIDVPRRGVLHSTEGSSVAGAVDAYRNGNSWPHTTVDPWERRKVQHVDLDLAARALYNEPGGVETNRAGAVQIEIVMFADLARAQQLGLADYHVGNLGDDEYAFLREVLREHEAATGINPKFDAAFKPYPASYGENNGVRLTDDAWYAATGWVGHLNIPDGNDHGDPGALNQTRLLPPIPPPPALEEDDMPQPIVDNPTNPKSFEWADLPPGKLVIKSKVKGDNSVTAFVHPRGAPSGRELVKKVLKEYGRLEVDHEGGSIQVTATQPILAGPQA